MLYSLQVFDSFLLTFVVYHVAMEIVAQYRAALYSATKLRNSATHQVALCNMPCQTCEFDAGVKVAR